METNRSGRVLRRTPECLQDEPSYVPGFTLGQLEDCINQAWSAPIPWTRFHYNGAEEVIRFLSE